MRLSPLDSAAVDPAKDEPAAGRHPTAQDEVYDLLKAKILSGEFAGGMRLNPIEIGALLGVSRTPVREAFHRLDVEGLITITPNRGAVVTTLLVYEVWELFKIRISLESLAAAEAAQWLHEDALDEFELLLRRMERVRGDPKQWISRHEAFHDRIYQFARMPRLSAEIKRIREAIHPHLRLYIDVYHHTEMPGYEHESLLSAIASRDPDRAARAVREHIECAAEGVLAFLEARSPGAAESVPPVTSNDTDPRSPR
jgi:DNA-binding GntR family transcriptional regulator